jgi:hypothetical protein
VGPGSECLPPFIRLSQEFEIPRRFFAALVS